MQNNILLLSSSFFIIFSIFVVQDASAQIIDCNDPVIQPNLRELNLIAESTILPTQDGEFQAMTFNGQIPGPTLRAIEGDLIRITLTVPSDENMAYGIGTSAANIPEIVSRRIQPGESKTVCFEANKPGVFRYNSTGVDFVGMERQVFSGMYGMIIVDPANGYKKLMVEKTSISGQIDRKFYSADVLEFQLQYNQLYITDDGVFDMAALFSQDTTQSVVNGMSFGYGPPLGYGPNEFCPNPNTTELTQLYEIPIPWATQSVPQYHSQIISAPVDEPTRWFVQNHGDQPLIFSIQDEMLERITLHNSVIVQDVERWTIEPHQGIIVDVLFEEPGTYFAVNEFGDEEGKGAMSAIVAGDILGCFSPPQNICNPSDLIPPMGQNSKEQKIILHGLYTDERAQRILQLHNAIQSDDPQLSFLCGSGHSSREISGEVDYAITFRDEIGTYRIKDNWANPSPFTIDEIDASIFYEGVNVYDMTATETTGDSGIFEGEFIGRDIPIPTLDRPKQAELVYNPGIENMLLDTHHFGCASEITPFDTESFEDGDYTAFWGSGKYCPIACGKITIYDTGLIGENVDEVSLMVRGGSLTSDLSFNAYNPLAGDGYYGTAFQFAVHGFEVGDEVELQYKDVTQTTLMECSFDIPDHLCGMEGLRCIAPIKQTSIGISPDKVTCNENLELIIKKTYGTPACVKPDTKLKLIQRGWALK